MKDISGKTASGLRVLVLLLLAGMCYELGYKAGFTNGDWHSRQRQVWEAVGGKSAASGGADDDAAISKVDLDAIPPNGIVLAPPVVLNQASPFASDHVSRRHHSHAFAWRIFDRKS